MIDVAIEDVLDHEGIAYRIRPGTSSSQVNVHTCPECGNNNYKVYFSQETSQGICFRCDTRFDTFSYAKAFHKFNNSQTYEYLKSFNQGFLKRDKVKSGESKVVSQTLLPDSIQLPVDNQNLSYLVNRGITNDTTQHFNLRYSQSGKFYYRHDDEQKSLDFSETIIIPIHDLSGKLITFQGRDITGERKRKYLFPPGQSTSGSVIYNAHNAVGFNSIIINEGVFDVMATHQALKEHSLLADIVPVATFGKHLSHRKTGEDQLSILLKLKRYGADKIYFCWDGSHDAALSALKGMKLLNGLGFDVLFVRLPEDKDPNEVSSNTLIRCIEKAERYTNSLEVKIKLRQY